jgi:hypothetical protein
MKAHSELHRVKSLHAFNIPDAKRMKINQHVTAYIFDDGSRLDIYATTSQGIAWKDGVKVASHKLLINRQGN